MSEPVSSSLSVEALAEEFLERRRQGQRPTVAEYLERYPHLADEIRAFFPALGLLEKFKPRSEDQTGSEAAAPVPGPSAPLEQLGDYRILREIGRGGMGVVYEAEQQALGRRVALKVLFGPAAQNAKLLARFRRESRAAAQLHHTNIVPVFDVGQQADTCYYAMQFIRGQALDEVFRELQRLRAANTPGSAQEAAAPAGPLAQSLWTGKFEPAAASGTVEHEPGPTTAVEPAPEPAETNAAALPDHSELSSVASNYQCYCRNVARLGLQVAQALAYAHAHGIIHRDIKPANLLLDTSGVLWVSDFGLVKTQDPSLTATGDLVGTLRYMAPERFRGECDALADVYALGLTLYELLVLRPVFDGKDRLHLVEQIGRQEPARLRVLDPRIPRDLETILMKAIEKDPRRRYASANDLAEDLRRYLADEPIKARRIGPLERLGRWGRRNPLVAGLSAAVVLITAIGFAGVFGQMQVAQANELKAQEHAAQAEQKEQEAKNERDQLQRTLYVSDMNLAQHAWEAGGIGRVRELLERHRPKAGDSDLRNFEWYYLYRLGHSDLLTLKDAGGDMAFSPDGKRLASSGKVWDAQTGQELLTVLGTNPSGHGLAYSPDGKRLATASKDNTVKVWDAQTGDELLSLIGHSEVIYCVAYSPDGKRLATASGDKTVKVWDAHIGKELLSFNGLNGPVAFSPDSKRLASTSGDHKSVRVLDTQTGQELLTVLGSNPTGHGLAYSPDGKRLASGSWNGTVTVWDATTGQKLLSIKEPSNHVNGIAYSPDGKRLASTSLREVKVWDALTGRELLSLKGAGWNVAFSPDGKRLATVSGGGINIWDATTNQESRTLTGHTQTGHTQYVTTVAFSPDGKRLASGTSTRDDTRNVYVAHDVKVWDAQIGQELLSLKGHTRAVNKVAFSRDGKRLASASNDKTVKVWDAQTGKDLLTFTGHTSHVVSVAFSPDSTRLASSSSLSYQNSPSGDPGEPGEVKIWDSHTSKELLSLKGHRRFVNSVAFSPDGERLATLSRDNTVKVWDTRTGKEIRTLKANCVLYGSVVFSPDGKRLASTSAGEIKVWEVQAGQELLSLRGHTGDPLDVVFSPDGKRLATASHDEALKVWDAQTGQELLTLPGGMVSVTFSPDGHLLASAVSGTVKIWDATPLPEKP